MSEAKGRCEIGVLVRADGSARWRQQFHNAKDVSSSLSSREADETSGNDASSVLAAVYAPRLAFGGAGGGGGGGGGAELGERASVEVSIRSAEGGGARAPLRCMEATCCGALEAILLREAYPRCTISVHVQIERDAGGIESCIVNAAVAACIDAGLQMTGLLVAMSFAVQPNGTVNVDPDARAIADAKAAVHIVLLARAIDDDGRDADDSKQQQQQQQNKEDRNDVVAFTSIGILDTRALDKCMALSRNTKQSLVEAMRRPFLRAEAAAIA